MSFLKYHSYERPQSFFRSLEYQNQVLEYHNQVLEYQDHVLEHYGQISEYHNYLPTGKVLIL